MQFKLTSFLELPAYRYNSTLIILMAKEAIEMDDGLLVYSLVLLVQKVPTYQLTLTSPPTSAFNILKRIQQQFIGVPNLVLFQDEQCLKSVTPDQTVTNGQQLFLSVSLDIWQQQIQSWFSSEIQPHTHPEHPSNIHPLQPEPTHANLQPQPVKHDPPRQQQNRLTSQILQPLPVQISTPKNYAQIHPQQPFIQQYHSPDPTPQKLYTQQKRLEVPKINSEQPTGSQTMNNSSLQIVRVQAGSPVSTSCCQII